MNNRLISSIIHDDRYTYPEVTVTREDRDNSNLGNTFGTLFYTIKYNANVTEENSRNLFLELLKNNIINISLNIDARFLTDEIIDELNKAKYLSAIRIVNEGYKVNNDLLEKLAPHILVYADEKEDNLKEEYQDRITLQHGVYKCSVGSSERELIFSYFLNHDPSDEELEMLVQEVNNNIPEKKAEIDYRCYNPKEYKKLIERLKNHGLREEVAISFLGNPLYDDTTSFKDIDKISKNPIKIVYNTCQDMVEMYEKEPYETNNQHRSEIEGGGVTTPESYQGLLEILDEQQRHIEEMEYSPLEATVYIYRYLQQNYAYDPDYETTDAINTLRNRQLDLFAGKTTLVCEGYATLFSALMRRCDIPLFRYSTEAHCRNIGRIKDKKYDVDNICVFDATFDGSRIDENGKFQESNSFKYFMLSPEETANYDPFITIPTSLAIDYEKTGERAGISSELKDMLGFLSNDSYERHLDSNYCPDGYAIRMLELMGLEPKYTSYSEYRNFIKELNNTSIFDEISTSTIAKAYVNVLMKEKILPKDLSELDIDFREMDTSLDLLKDRMSRQEDYLGVFRTIRLNDNEREILVSCYPHNNTRKIEEFETKQKEKDDTTKEENKTGTKEKTTYHLTKDEIIQDLPINSKEKDRDYNGMSNEEIRNSQIKLGFISEEIKNNTTYHLTRNEIIQDLPIYSTQETRYKGIMTDAEIEESKEKIKIKR